MVGTTNKSMGAFLGHVFGDSRLSHRKAKLEQFTMNVRCPQSRLSTLVPGGVVVTRRAVSYCVPSVCRRH